MVDQEIALPDEFESVSPVELERIFESVREEVLRGDIVSLEEYAQTRHITFQPMQHVHNYSSETY